MLSIRTVLCPVDLSASTARQLDVAVDLCRAFGARLILHHNMIEMAIGSGVGWMWEPGHSQPAIEPDQKLQELRATVPAGTDVETRVTRGPIAEAIVTVSRRSAPISSCSARAAPRAMAMTR
jgi:nucleotide-binding universal stress UspA family protein